MATEVFTGGSTTWTCPAGVFFINVYCIGGGGGGGGAAGNPSAGGGGKGGGFAQKLNYAVTPSSIYSLQAGLAGESGVDAAGGNGQASWFHSDAIVLGTGGGGGAYASTNNSNGAGGTTVIGTAVGDLTYVGGNGAAGASASGAAGGAGGGAAGSTGNGNNASTNVGGASTDLYGGAGADGPANSSHGLVGGLYGGGGSGAKANTNPNKDGGAGGVGAVIIMYDDPILNSSNFLQFF